MSTISENLQIIKNSTLAMKQAIIDKGGNIDGDITTWADSISNISSGGSESTLNFDGVTEDFTNANYHEVTHLIIKEGVTSLFPSNEGYGAFEYWNIESVELPSTLNSIGRAAFRNSNLKKITIPNSVTSLSSNSFADTDQLQYVIMPNQLISMDGEGEFNDSSVEYIYFNNAEIIPSLGLWGMLGGPVFESHTKIIVPDNLYDSWRNANGWSEYADQIYRASEYPIPNE